MDLRSGYVPIPFRLRLIPLVLETKSWKLGYERLGAEVDWVLFYLIQGWYFILFLIFVTIRELIHLVGNKKVRRTFFGF